MMFAQNMLIFISVFFYLVLMGMVLLWLRRENNVASSAPAGCRISRVVEAIMFLCGAAIASIYAMRLTQRHDNILLHLSDLQPAYAATHLILAGIVCAVLLASLVLCIFGRTSLAVLISVTVLMGYGILMGRCGYSKVPYLMTLIAPEGSWEPIINYTFQMEENPEQQADLWVNDIYLGKMPLAISGQELYKKIPVLDRETESLYRQKTHGQEREFCQITMIVRKSDDYPDGHYWYTPGFEHYFAKVKTGDTLHKPFGFGRCNSDSGGPRYDYIVTIPDTLEAHQNKFDTFKMIDTLLDKARMNNYQVDTEWKNALFSHGEYGWKALRNAAIEEKGFEALIDQWVIDEYRIDKDSPQQIFERISEEADAEMVYRTGFLHGRAIEMIYDKLDYVPLVAEYKKAVKSKWHLDSGGHTRLELTGNKCYIQYNHRPNEYLRGEVLPASFSVIRHVLQLWDKKLNAENLYQDNLIEAKITPAMLVYRYDLDLAEEFGGSVYEQYLQRQYRRHRQIEGIDMGHENYTYEGGQHLNKWLYHLVRLNTPGGKEFRRRNSSATKKLVEVIVNSSFNNKKEVPEFIFYDLESGQNSLAYQFWPDYLIASSEYSSGWEHDKFKRNLGYLVRLGDLATDDMYQQCWQYVDLNKLFGDGRVVKVLDVLPAERKRLMARVMLESIDGNKKVANWQVIVKHLRELLEKEQD